MKMWRKYQRRGKTTPLDQAVTLRPDNSEAWDAWCDLHRARGEVVDEGRFLDWCRLAGIDDAEHQRRLWRRVQAVDAVWSDRNRKQGDSKDGKRAEIKDPPRSGRVSQAR